MPGMQITQAGNGPTGMTNTSGAIPNVSTLIPLTQPSSTVIVNNGSSTAVLYVSFGSTVSNSGYFFINALQSLNYSGPPVTSVNIIGTNGSGNYAVLAW
jgi:hypothetical protein